MGEASSVVDLFRDVPGPSPWNLTPKAPVTVGFSWQSAGDGSHRVGKTLLVGSRGVVAILDFRSYAKPLNDSSLLIWHQNPTKIAPTPPVRLIVMEPAKLRPFEGDIDVLCSEMDREIAPIMIGGTSSAGINLQTTVLNEELRADFPAMLRTTEELLIWCCSSAIDLPDWDQKFGWALLIAHPLHCRFKLYPQDWFNHGGFDYGYQWPTKAVRDRRTGRVHGRGANMSPFVLSDSLRELDEI